MVRNEELRTRILESTIAVFNRKGLKLTMSDIAKEISISKKTIYKEFESKDELFDEMVDYIFDTIKAREEEIANDSGISTIERLRALLGAMPDNYQGINFQDLHPLKEKYPEVYKKIENRLETGWETTIELIEQGKKEGVVRQDADFRFVKIMFEASIEKMLSDNTLEKSKIKYMDALNAIVDILVDGIAVR